MNVTYKNGGKAKAGDVIRYAERVGFVNSVHTNGVVAVCLSDTVVNVMAADCERAKVTFPAKRKAKVKAKKI